MAHVSDLQNSLALKNNCYLGYREQSADCSYKEKWPVFERYQILGAIGKGELSEVYKSFDYTELKYVAIKFLNAEIHGESKKKVIEKIFQNELGILKKMRHKNVVKLIDDFTIQNEERVVGYFLVMKLCEGGDLHQLIQSGFLQEQQILSFAY